MLPNRTDLSRLGGLTRHRQARLRPRGYLVGSDRGSPNQGSTLFSKRVIAQIRSPVRVRTKRPAPWRVPVGARRYAPTAGWPLARVGTRENLRPAPNRL